MTTKLISMRLSVTLIEQIERFAEGMGATRTDAVNALLSEALARRDELIGKPAPQILAHNLIDGHWRKGAADEDKLS